ncbi:hypothetical protein NG99_23710 [Erwinia typographi]|uniref:Glycosyltransferase 2-like domain-containing protein n=1 Tax=Erwinia typographi TaxID=371042 RepID=A0A0A3YKA5_9GAMM|nr:glycosyltransferase [Erwinia typographi]KGT87232.1 hypothetical protein NG99_23710 [Erwinia typographi]
MGVFIDGVEYAPASKSMAKIGVAITTHNRNDMLIRALEHHVRFLPAGAVLVVVDDGSRTPVSASGGVKVIRHNEALGIATAKNASLSALMDAGCEHIFLFDDDCWPVVDKWWQPYIESPEPHLAHSWNLVEIWSDSQHTASHASGGTVLYYERRVIDDVGGMRTIFGKYGCEHVNLSDRIHNRGWTTWRYADVTGSEKLFYECDRHEKNTHKTVAAAADLQHNASKGRDLWMTMLDDDQFVEYRQAENVVITTLLTGMEDTQRNGNMRPDVSLISALATSVRHGRLIVMHDRLVNPQMKTGNGIEVEFIQVENKINPYFGRWLHVYQLLRDKPNIGKVWVVDGTDVQQLRDPFDIAPGWLYIGQEQAAVNNEWLKRNHPDTRVQDFIRDNPELTLLNPGTVGGDRATVQRFAHLMVRYWFDDHIDFIHKWETGRAGVGDMGATQLIGYSSFADRLIYGPSVNTHFKSEKADEYARWKHK